MAAGIIPYSSIPNPVPEGLYFHVIGQLKAAGGSSFLHVSPAGYEVSDVATAQVAINAYAGSAAELQWNKDQKQAQLDANLETNFNLIAFIRNGTLTPVTGAQVSNFLATECNNYRTLRAQIAAATTVAQVNAININAGWPNNP